MLDAFSFNCGYNGCFPPAFQTKEAFLLCFLIFGIAWFILRRFWDASAAIYLSAIALLLLTSVPQMYYRATDLGSLIGRLLPLSASEKRFHIFASDYLFPDKVHRFFPGIYKARVITDINLCDGDGWGTRDRLAYYLYPIDIYSTLNQDMLIYYKKDNAVNLVPTGYKVILKIDDRNLVALPKGAL
ncbi:MAG: hypothetical protein HQL22_11290 [Candidatus Omnitrophica bacterium]|nr:hypothetical protein [Candidatus Omnitrophota bacterium]